MTINSKLLGFSKKAAFNKGLLAASKGLVAAGVLAVALMSSSAMAMKAPDQVVKETVNAMVDKIQTNRATYTKDTNALYAMVENTLVPALHVDRMSNLILGKQYSRIATPEQKKAFSSEFKTFLMRSYATALLEYTGNEKVVYEPVQLAPTADKVTIKATLVASDGQAYPINLYMSNRRDTQWRAYNIEVANINFVGTYRSTFGDIMAKKGVEGLIAELRSKNAKNAS